jgi:hypothetical protein
MNPGIQNMECFKQHEIFMLQICWNYIFMNQSSGRKDISIIKYNNEARNFPANGRETRELVHRCLDQDTYS